MNTLSIDGWRKADNDSKSIPIGTLQFYVSEAEHLRLEQAEEQLQRSGVRDAMIDADMRRWRWLPDLQQCGDGRSAGVTGTGKTLPRGGKSLPRMCVQPA